MTGTKLDADGLRRANRSLVLRLLKERGEASRIELAKATSLSPTTVSAIIDELAGLGIARELRVGESSGGRKPLLYSIDPEGRFVVSCSIGPRGASFALVGLGGGVAHRVELEGPVSGAAAVRAALLEGASAVLERSGVDAPKVVGCAVCVPGLVDGRERRILYSMPLALSDLDLGAALEPLGFGAIRLYKDADALLLAERRSGAGRGCDNIAYVWVDSGVGMSYLHEGELMILPKGGFELGHVAIDYDGAACKCGSTGCLGTMISELPAVERYAGLSGKGAGATTYAEILRLAAAGDESAARVVEEEATILAVALSNIVNLFNPELVIVGGPWREGGAESQELVRRLALGRILEPFREGTRILFSEQPEEARLAAMAERLFKEELFESASL